MKVSLEHKELNASDGSIRTTECLEKRLRVALVYSACHARGGVERVMLEAANYLSRVGHQSCVLAREFADESFFDSRVTRTQVNSGPSFLGLGLSRFKREAQKLVQSNAFDVVAGFGVQSPDDSVLWVQSVHATWWEQCQSRRRGIGRLRQQWNPFHKVVLRLERRMFEERKYRRIIALTPAVKNDLQRFYNVPHNDVEILPNGFRGAEFNQTLRERFRVGLRTRLQIPANAWVVLFVANEWERKGLLPLMEAIARGCEKDVYLVVAGRLPKRLLGIHADRLGIGKRVRFVGGAEPVNQWFGMADAFVLPTLYEAWGMVVIEALACGVPVLTSVDAGAAVAVSPGRNGWLLRSPQDPDEVMAGLQKLRNGVSCEAPAIAASVSQYEWSVLFERYEQILRASL
ncbi:MAG: glycosyltransferase family 4 protein [Verrucomicrobiota bacterium]